MKQTSYHPSRVSPWTEETVTEEWALAKEAEVTQLHWERKHISGLPSSLFSADDSMAKSLQELLLDTNKLTELPESMKNLASLEVLDLSSNNFTDFPLCILSLKSLRVLKMERNKLTSLPSNLHELSNLEHVTFFGNQIEHIDDQCFQGMKALRKVDLELNFIAQVPQSLLDLQSTTENFILNTDDMSAPPIKKAPRRQKSVKVSTKKRPRRTAAKSDKPPPAKRQRK